jgi:hypothetical protein
MKTDHSLNPTISIYDALIRAHLYYGDAVRCLHYFYSRDKLLDGKLKHSAHVAPIIDLLAGKCGYQQAHEFYCYVRHQGYSLEEREIQAMINAYCLNANMNQRLSEWSSIVSDVSWTNILLLLIVGGGTILERYCLRKEEEASQLGVELEHLRDGF